MVSFQHCAGCLLVLVGLCEARDFIFAEPLRIDSEGYVHLPQKPGLGLELDGDKLKQYEQADTTRLI